MSRKRASFRIKCPHCDNYLRLSGAKHLTPFYRTSHASCENPDCRAIFEVGLELVRQIDSGDNPNPDVQMPNVCKAAISQPQPATPKTTKE